MLAAAKSFLVSRSSMVKSHMGIRCNSSKGRSVDRSKLYIFKRQLSLSKLLEYANYLIGVIVIAGWVIPSRWNFTNKIWSCITPFPLSIPLSGETFASKESFSRPQTSSSAGVSLSLWPIIYGYLFRRWQEQLSMRYIGVEKFCSGYRPLGDFETRRRENR